MVDVCSKFDNDTCNVAASFRVNKELHTQTEPAPQKHVELLIRPNIALQFENVWQRGLYEAKSTMTQYMLNDIHLSLTKAYSTLVQCEVAHREHSNEIGKISLELGTL